VIDGRGSRFGYLHAYSYRFATAEEEPDKEARNKPETENSGKRSTGFNEEKSQAI